MRKLLVGLTIAVLCIPAIAVGIKFGIIAAILASILLFGGIVCMVVVYALFS